MYKSSLRHIHDPVLSSLKMKGIRLLFFGKASHHPALSVPLQPRFGSLRLLAFPKAKIAVERVDICECDVHTVHRVAVHNGTARSPLTGCQVTSRPRYRFSGYSKWLDAFRTALVSFDLRLKIRVDIS
jgi:hypothetical protein